MQISGDKQQRERVIDTTIIAIFCVLFAVFQFFDIKFTSDIVRSAWIKHILSNSSATVVVIILMKRLQIKAFQRPNRLVYFLPCIAMALVNLPFISYFNGNMSIVRNNTWDILFFVLYCLSVGILEELVFRGILFSAFLGRFPKDKKGMFKAFVFSSVFFGLAHLSNLFSGAGIGAVLLQVVYTTLTGGLFCFAFIQTKNILFSAGTHALYNMCGLIFEIPARFGLGTGIIFDTGTIVVMAVVDVLIAIFVFYSLYKYPEEDRKALYDALNVKKP